MRHLHISKGHGDPLNGKLRLELLLRGTRRNKPGGNDQRLPITPLILDKIFQILNRNPGKYENKLMWAACCLGFFAFFRSGEFTVQSNEPYNPSWHLSVQDVAVDSVDNPSVLQVGIKGSKTDQWRRGIFLMVGRTEKICPVKAMLVFLAVRGFKSGLLFCFRDGTPLSRQQFVKRLREILCAAEWIALTSLAIHSGLERPLLRWPGE